MNSLSRNLLRIGVLGIWPLILLLSFLFLLRHRQDRETLKKYGKNILLNSILFAVLLSIAVFLFFRIEDTVYSYDYAGHWIRSLQLQKWFYEDPAHILPELFRSMNENDYSFLPGVLSLFLTLWQTSYGWFCLSIIWAYLFPLTLLLQLIYFRFYTNRYLPLLIGIIFYPLWFILFNGESDGGGLFFVTMILALLLARPYEESDLIDHLAVNLYAFLMIFFRRWYLYVLIVCYLLILVRYLLQYRKDLLSKESLQHLLYTVLTGLPALLVILIFFRPFVGRVLGSNFSEAYSFYDRSGKLAALINFFSLPILLISLYGLYGLYQKKRYAWIAAILTAIILPTFLFWRIQSYEHHHYCIILLPILTAFTEGLHSFSDKKIILLPLSILLAVQSFLIFTPVKAPLLTSVKRIPDTETAKYKNELLQFSLQLRELTSGEGISAYLASGSSVLNDDMIRNVLLPDLDQPQIDTAVLDLRDGFPKDLEYIRYVILIDPIQYLNKDYQHIYEVITEAIQKEPLVKELYQPVYETKIDELKVTVYERTGDFSPAVKEYFYQKMLEYYPDKADFFAYILD
ncbi:MAG: hypothetical protein IKE21_02505 [Erysipelotrichaceae bacterium]|nr:hypothetical protein [Erysipelotrichaceae bacterium]